MNKIILLFVFVLRRAQARQGEGVVEANVLLVCLHPNEIMKQKN